MFIHFTNHQTQEASEEQANIEQDSIKDLLKTRSSALNLINFSGLCLRDSDRFQAKITRRFEKEGLKSYSCTDLRLYVERTKYELKMPTMFLEKVNSNQFDSIKAGDYVYLCTEREGRKLYVRPLIVDLYSDIYTLVTDKEKDLALRYQVSLLHQKDADIRERTYFGNEVAILLKGKYLSHNYDEDLLKIQSLS